MTPEPLPDGPTTPPAPRRRVVGRLLGTRAGRGLARAWDATPLRTRVVGLLVLLLALGLVLSGLASALLLQRSLVAQIDEKLRDEGTKAANTFLRGGGDYESAGDTPSDYCLWLRWAGDEDTVWVQNNVEQYGRPAVPALELASLPAEGTAAFTVASDVAGSRWRTVVFPITSRITGEVVGSAAVSLPLADVEDTGRTMVLVLLLSGLGIVLLGVLGGTWAVRRSMRPLRDIEATAAAIAAGDLSQRVPAAPPSTEVGRLGGALNSMLTQIEGAFDARTASEARMRRFVADASHELRTPLAAIRGYGELYRMGAIREPEQLEDTMRRIEGSATRMGGLVEDLLHLARLDEHRPMATAPVDLTVLAADALSDLHALDPSRAARLVPLDPGAPLGPCVVTGDEGRLRQVLANLVGNVVQHTPGGSPVEIAVGAADGWRVVEVRDHGPGIPPEHAARVFERFYRVDASRGRASGGAGLGMAIVAAIVAAHAGDVSLSPTPGGGTTVRVALPPAADPGALGGYDDATEAPPLSPEG